MFFTESGSPSPAFGNSTAAAEEKENLGMANQVEFTQELMPIDCLVQLPSKWDKKSAKRPLFLVHAIEGVVTPLKTMANELDCPVWGLQCVADAPLETIEQLASFYIKQVKTVQKTGPYTIAGYSFGAAVAFEMVAQLEAQKEKCTLIMLDGSPRYVSWYTDSQSKKSSISESSAQAEAYCLAYFAMVAGNLHYTTVAKELEILNSFDERLTRVAEMVATQTKHDNQLVSDRRDGEFKRGIVINFCFSCYRSKPQHLCSTRRLWRAICTGRSRRSRAVCV